jgi:NMD protein affecting ribosome stability and mRNA decay
MATRIRKDYGTCACGKKLHKYDSGVCSDCYKAKMEKHYDECQAIWNNGICPTCGAKLQRNYSMSGWVQCEQLGAVGFRKDETKPSCNYQFFLRG